MEMNIGYVKVVNAPLGILCSSQVGMCLASSCGL